MKYQNLQFFNSNGYNLNLSVSSLISFNIDSYIGEGANILGITDPNGYLIDTFSINKGTMYTNNVNNLSIKLIYALNSSKNKYLNLYTNDPSCDASVNFVSINANNAGNTITTFGIDSLTFTNNIKNDTYVYPSLSFAGNLFMEPVSKGLVSTMSIYILEQFYDSLDVLDSPVYKRPIDNTKKLIFTLNNDNIKFFTINDNSQDIIWTNKLIFDLSDNSMPDNQPLQLNIGFVGESQGIYEEHLNVYIEENDKYYLIGEILINAECIDEDERFRVLFSNFGIPDPISYSNLFKEANINESKIDYNLVNKKSKELFLEYSNIFPYVGTYKALINSIKFLGYDDISFREWFLNINEQRYDSYEISYDNSNRSKTLLNETIEKRIGLKKLNKLSMIYKINKESSDTDEYGIPIVNNVYDYNNDEILLKLFYLKKWLENNIIGINCRIIDITGEGIYFERYDNKIYSTGNESFDVTNIKYITPYTVDDESELIDGSAYINLSFQEFNNKLSINDYSKIPIKDFVDYIYDINLNSQINLSDYNYLDDKQIVISSPISIPTLLDQFQFKCHVNTLSGTITKNIDNPIWVVENEIKFYDNKCHEANFGYNNNEFNYLKLPTIQIEKGYLRELNSANWSSSIRYEILYDEEGFYKIVDVKNNSVVVISYDYISFVPNVNSSLKYTDNNKFNLPLFIFNNYDIIANPKNSNKIITFNSLFDSELILDIEIGKIINYESEYKISYINFTYDNADDEQSIKLNVSYISDKYDFYKIDPIKYYYNNEININNEISLNVNNIGKYIIESYGWDNFNNLFYNKINNEYNVYMKIPTLYTYTVQNYTNNSSTFYNDNIYGDIDNTVDKDYIYNLYQNNNIPIFNNNYILNDLTINQASPTGDPYDLNPNAVGPLYVTYPYKSYYIDTPKLNDKLNFINITEECTLDLSDASNINKLILNSLNLGYQKFHIGDTINIIIYDINLYKPIAEINNKILSIENDVLILENPLNTYELNILSDDDFVDKYENINNWETIISYILYNNKIKDNIKIYVQNISEYDVITIKNDIYNNEDVIMLTLNPLYNDAFLPDQIIKLIYKVTDESTNNIKYYGSTSFKYIKFNNGYHILKGNYNELLINNLYKKYAEVNNNAEIPLSYILKMSFANQAFVHYTVDVLYSYENNGLVNVFFKDQNKLGYYIDNTYSLYNLKFNSNDAYENWMSYYDESSINNIPDIILKYDTTLLNFVYTSNTGSINDLQNVYYRDSNNNFLYKVRYQLIQEYLPIYKYSIPITIDPNMYYINNDHKTYNIIFDAIYDSSSYINEKNNIWKIYHTEDDTDKNKLLMEVLNDTVFLNIKNKGIYSINLKTYDKYGNLVEQNKNGFIKF